MEGWGSGSIFLRFAEAALRSTLPSHGASGRRCRQLSAPPMTSLKSCRRRRDLYSSRTTGTPFTTVKGKQLVLAARIAKRSFASSLELTRHWICDGK